MHLYCLVSTTLIIERSKSHILPYAHCTEDHTLQASYLVQTTASHSKEDL